MAFSVPRLHARVSGGILPAHPAYPHGGNFMYQKGWDLGNYFACSRFYAPFRDGVESLYLLPPNRGERWLELAIWKGWAIRPVSPTAIMP